MFYSSVQKVSIYLDNDSCILDYDFYAFASD